MKQSVNNINDIININIPNNICKIQGHCNSNSHYPYAVFGYGSVCDGCKKIYCAIGCISINNMCINCIHPELFENKCCKFCHQFITYYMCSLCHEIIPQCRSNCNMFSWVYYYYFNGQNYSCCDNCHKSTM